VSGGTDAGQCKRPSKRSAVSRSIGISKYGFETLIESEKAPRALSEDIAVSAGEVHASRDGSEVDI
jgi:hypothetical protein